MDRIKAERITEGEVADIDTSLSNLLPWYKDAPFVTKTILINMAYNMGVKGLLGFKNTLAYVKQGNYAQAAKNMKLSLWYSQVGSRGEELVKRMETQTIPKEFEV